MTHHEFKELFTEAELDELFSALDEMDCAQTKLAAQLSCEYYMDYYLAENVVKVWFIVDGSAAILYDTL